MGVLFSACGFFQFLRAQSPATGILLKQSEFHCPRMIPEGVKGLVFCYMFVLSSFSQKELSHEYQAGKLTPKGIPGLTPIETDYNRSGLTITQPSALRYSH